MKKRLLALLLATAMVLCLFGCTQEPIPTEPPTEPPTQAPTEPPLDTEAIIAELSAMTVDAEPQLLRWILETLGEDTLLDLQETFRDGWKGLLLPLVILLPFLLDVWLKDGFFTQRLGAAGAKAFSGAVLLFVGGIATVFACLIAKDKKQVTPQAIAKMFSGSVKSISPAIAVCIFGYMIGALFADLDVATQLGGIIEGLQFGKLGTVLIICVITCFMGMVVPGSSQVVIFGPMFIELLANVGVDPLLAAAMLPCICGVMCGITPPLALGMYAGMSIAQSDLGKTVKNDLWWVFAQFALQVIVLMGWLPILGL